MKRQLISLLAFTCLVVWHSTCHAQLFGRNRAVRKEVVVERGRARAAQAVVVQKLNSGCRQEVFFQKQKFRSNFVLPSGLTITPFAVQSFSDNGTIYGVPRPLTYSYRAASYQQPAQVDTDAIVEKLFAKLTSAQAVTSGSAVERNCLECHGSTNPKKGFSVIGMTEADMRHAAAMVYTGEMPRGKQITNAERDAIVRELLEN